MRLFVVLLLVSGCLGNGSQPAPPDIGADLGSGHEVAMQNFSFEPPDLVISQGEAVTWINQDDVAHHVASEDGSFDSGRLPPGARYSRAFEAPGQYPFRCVVHPAMAGSIRVT